MSIYSATTLRTRRIRWHFFLHFIPVWYSEAASPSDHRHDSTLHRFIVVIEPFPLLFRLLNGQHALTLRGYGATSCFGVYLTSSDGLFVQLHTPQIILKCSLCVSGSYFHPEADINRFLKMPATVWTRSECVDHVSHGVFIFKTAVLRQICPPLYGRSGNNQCRLLFLHCRGCRVLCNSVSNGGR